MAYQINLLPPKEQNVADKIIYFAFHYLRYILVLTQLVVICVFFYRFRVDQEIIDLRDNIKQKKEVMMAVEPLVKEVAMVNGKIKDAQNILVRQLQFSEIYSYFLKKIPSSLVITSMKLDLKNIECEGMTESATSVRMFYEDLLDDGTFEKVELSSIQRDGDGYKFALKLQGFKHQNEL